MTGSSALPMLAAIDDALRTARERDPRIERHDLGKRSDPASEVLKAAARSASGSKRPVVVGPSGRLLVDAFAVVRSEIAAMRAPVVIVGETASAWEGPGPPVIEDIGLARSLPSMSVAVPADPPQAAEAFRELLTLDGPSYLRLSGTGERPISDGRFVLGRAAELREGADLTIAAAGPPLALALSLSEELSRVGVGARVLDLASVKPFDATAVLRAARATGAVLTLEEQSVLSGVGAIVSSITAEEYPVPVRRIGAPDLYPTSAGPPTATDPYGLSMDRLVEAAYELLRARGKVQ